MLRPQKPIRVALLSLPLEGGRCSVAELSCGLPALLLALCLNLPSAWFEWKELDYAARCSPWRLMGGPPPGRN